MPSGTAAAQAAWATIGCFSFYPTKNLGGFGDGGFMTATDAKVAERLKLLRGHGMQPRYYHHVVGINSRLDTLQAAVLNVKLRYLDAWTSLRQANAERYAKLFAEYGLSGSISLPAAEAGSRHVWNQYVDPHPRRAARRAAQLPGRAQDRQRDLLSRAAAPAELASASWAMKRAACPRANGRRPRRWPCRSFRS